MSDSEEVTAAKSEEVGEPGDAGCTGEWISLALDQV